MKWRQVDQYHAESDAGYRVCRVYFFGQWIYEAWTPGGIETARCIYRGRDRSSAQARHKAELHFREAA